MTASYSLTWPSYSSSMHDPLEEHTLHILKICFLSCPSCSSCLSYSSKTLIWETLIRVGCNLGLSLLMTTPNHWIFLSCFWSPTMLRVMMTRSRLRFHLSKIYCNVNVGGYRDLQLRPAFERVLWLWRNCVVGGSSAACVLSLAPKDSWRKGLHSAFRPLALPYHIRSVRQPPATIPNNSKPAKAASPLVGKRCGRPYQSARIKTLNNQAAPRVSWVWKSINPADKRGAALNGFISSAFLEDS